MDNTQEIVDLSQKLIGFRTTAENPEALKESVEFVTQYFSNADVFAKKFEKNGKSTLLVTLREEAPEILLNGHLDVVPGKDSQFTPSVEGGRIHGRGALDMKAAVATLMVLLKDLKKNGTGANVGLSLVTDEEIGGSNGSAYLIERNILPKFFISGEPTDLEIGNEARGVIWLKIKASGKSAHASTPWLGENANVKLVRALNRIADRLPTPQKEQWVTTRNLSVIQSGNVTNKVPDASSAIFDIRYVPTDDPRQIVEEIKNLCGDCVVEIENIEPAAYVNPKNDYVKNLEGALRNTGIEPKFIKKYAASDARHYTKAGIPAVVFGPKGKGQHADDEYVEIESLNTFYNVMKSFLTS